MKKLERKIFNIPQNWLNWENSGITREEFFAKYAEADAFTQRNLIESIPLQTNPEWLELKAKRFTASNADKFLAGPVSKAAKEAGEMGESAKGLVYRVLAESLTNWRAPEATWTENVAIKRGLVFEPIARSLAEEKLGKILECGFISYGEHFGYSPDGILADDPETGIEIKIFEPTAFLKSKCDCRKRETELQMQMQMWAGGLKRIFLVLYCPEYNPKKVYILKYTRGMAYQAQLDERAYQMLNYMDEVKEIAEQDEINIETAGE